LFDRLLEIAFDPVDFLFIACEQATVAFLFFGFDLNDCLLVCRTDGFDPLVDDDFFSFELEFGLVNLIFVMGVLLFDPFIESLVLGANLRFECVTFLVV